MKKLMHLIMLLCAGAFLAGCTGGGETEAGPTSTPDAAAAMQAAIQATMAAEQADRGEQIANWLVELEAAQEIWDNAEIDAYEISVLYVDTTRQVIQQHFLEVRDGEIVRAEAACGEQNPNCVIADINVENMTVSGLFSLAYNALVNDEINEFSGGFQFHEAAGFPQFIGLRAPNQVPWYWQVQSFTILP